MKMILIALSTFASASAFAAGFSTHSPAVLMYHDIVDSSSEATSSSDATTYEFKSQLEYLRANNYNVISMDEYRTLFSENRSAPAKSVVLTFDDGYSGTFRNAIPLLKQYNMSATFFVHTNYVGVPGNDNGSRDHATWNELAAVDASPLFDVYSHTLSHPDLTTLSDAQIESQLRNSRAALEQQLGGTRNVLAYPFGKYDQRVVEIAQRHYVMAFSIKDPASSSNLGLKLPRMIINREVSSISAFGNRLWNYINQ